MNPVTKTTQLNQASVGASFQAAPLIASSRKPFTDGEFVKKCINAVAEVVCPGKKDVLMLRAVPQRPLWATRLCSSNYGAAELHLVKESTVCVVGQRCILPCTFLPGNNTLIRWIQMSNNKCVHLYLYNKDQLGSQIPSFQSRTSLFQDQISRGNASLLLMWVKVEDQGRYMCYSSTDIDNSEKFIELKVEALIRNVNIKQLMEDGLYKISSTIDKNSTALSYSCTVSAGRNKRKTTLFKARPVTVSAHETTIFCPQLNTTVADLTWRFNQAEIILNRTVGADNLVSDSWKHHVKNVSQSGDLTLQHVSSPQEGTYTCDLSNGEETYVTITALTVSESPAQLNQASVGASFQAAPLIASSRKPFTDGEFVKKCINAVAEVVCPEKKDVFNAEGGAPAPPMGHPPLQLKLRGSRASFGQRLDGRKRPLAVSSTNRPSGVQNTSELT
ncbi:CD276 antigen -like protein [Takifugu flavidus]|uniref:CD276 antigen-like protein n=1 Tax=Takifugu flavidus TaxID=433684 RepID=A0A5C6NZZ9_9TELE|nr:CD276 antigen -like protein [Takifugu flavidus]